MSSFGHFGIAPKAMPCEYSGPHGVSETFEKAKREMGIPATAEKPDFTITEVKFGEAWGPNEHNDGGIMLYWSTRSAGFGTFSFYLKEGEWHCDNECMGLEFVKSVLNFWVDNMRMENDS
jgi:hypothetical protein